MKKKLFISNLDFDITSEQLRELFIEIAPSISVVVATDRESKRSKGFAFVEMEGEDGAKQAIDQLNNKVINGRPIKVVFDRGKGNAPESEGGRKYEPLPPIQRMQLFKRRRKVDPFLDNPEKIIDYKDAATLSRFVSERGRILSRRLTGLTAYNQRQVAKAIKRAQNVGLIPFTIQ
jgi:small subunit ribosomal protein S18